MSEETIRFLIEQKVAFVNSVVNVCMLWWASSIVFCGSVLAAVWTKREELRQRGFVLGLGIVLFVFFSVIAVFGFLVTYRLGIVQDEIAVLAADLKSPDDFFHTEILTFQISMILGAGSFALTCIVWIFFWLFLWKRREIPPTEQNLREEQHDPAQPPPNKPMHPTADTKAVTNL